MDVLNPEMAAVVASYAACIVSILGSIGAVVFAGKKIVDVVKGTKDKTSLEEQLKKEKEARLKAEANVKRLEAQNDLLLEKCLKVKQDRSR